MQDINNEECEYDDNQKNEIKENKEIKHNEINNNDIKLNREKNFEKLMPPKKELIFYNEINNEYKEYYDSNYYLKIIFDNEYIIIRVYNLKKLDGIRFEKKLNSHEILLINNDIKDIYNKMTNSIKEKKYEIKEKGDNMIILTIFIDNNKEKEEKLDIELLATLKNVLEEYYNILIHEIKKMKKNKGINISEIEEENKKIKEELEDIKQKSIEWKNKILNEKKVEIKIIEKNNLEFIDFDIRDGINIANKKYGNKIIDSIKKLELDGLKELRIYNCNISNINKLKEINIEKLKILGLNDNKIIDISILSYIKFESLEELWLSNNNINDINILEKCNFESLEKLDLSMNNISDISILEKANLKSLKELWLYKNKIKEIKCLENGNFDNLKKLDLSLNLITDVSVFSTDKSVFNNLQYLDLSHNEIKDINCFQEVKKVTGYFFRYYQSGILNNLNDLYLINNKIDYGRNSEVLNYLQSLKINFNI